MAHIVSINISEKRGTVKRPVEEARLLCGMGIQGDAHAGDWHRQISILAQESIHKMAVRGLEGLTPGTFAENITTTGIGLHTLPLGARLRLGDCKVEITQIGKECHRGCEVYRRTGMCVMPREGIFAQVITGGILRPGDPVEVLPEPRTGS
ncbi:MAG: MOSC domain-containing protein [Spirochaetaceae bacterium]|jgi:MOSC domain-containing protein YiiM|nr:MOSC domain-containing protein [Spirochaetaceae bacterium]